MIFLLFDSWFLCCHVSSALIPLSEFSEAAVMKKYAVQPDAKTLDIPNTAARQKSVSFFFPFFFGWMNLSSKPCQTVTVALVVLRGKKIPPLSPIPQHLKLGLHILISMSKSYLFICRMIMGSVSNHVVNNVACHVTAVKAHH